MRSIGFVAAMLAASAGFGVEPHGRRSEEDLSREQLVGKLEERNAAVSYVPRAPERAVSHVAIDETWKGGDEGIDYVERLARMEEGFRALYIVGEPEISRQRLKELESAVPDLRIERRGASFLGVAAGMHPQGAHLIKVEPGSPADKAGLQDWDVIAEFDGAPVDGFETLVKAIAARRPGERVEVKFLRGRKEHTTRVTLERWLLRPAAPDGARRQPSDPRPDGFGHVEGRFTLSGDLPKPNVLVKGGGACGPQDILDESLVVDSETKGIGNVFVYLRRAGDVHPDLQNPPDQPVRLQIENCVFKPHALLVRTRQPVLIESRDPTSHEIHPHDLRNQTGVLRRLKVGANERDGVRLQFQRSEILPIKVTCDVHPHMVGYWLVLDHPYAAITDEHGRFRIENLPAGEHKLTVWHERAGYLDRAFEVTVEPNRTITLEPVEVPAEAVRPRSHSPAGM